MAQGRTSDRRETKSAGARQRIILASASPRRRELMARMGLTFEVDAADVDEHAQGAPRELVRELAARKGLAVARRHAEGIVVAADTLVALDGRALGKPADAAEAISMLRMLGGREHDVFTGVCVVDVQSGRALSEVAHTRVTFRALSEGEIAAYVASGEPMDKAGAYAIQGRGAAFIAGYAGPYDNVMGLPCDLLARLLEEIQGEGLAPSAGPDPAEV